MLKEEKGDVFIMANKRGTLSINSENIFPIIKKWLYSDHDIFVREMISNGCDAITKLKKLEVMGDYTFPEGHKNKIDVIVNPEEKTLKFIDTGLGMTAEEVEEYITQIAFSGATEFLEKYKDKTNDDQIIGHFGLGFYSAFMVADEVHIDTLSYKEGAEPVHWECDGGTEYEMGEGNRTEVGTEITLFLNEDSLEFANEYRMREVIEKYCSFMPVEIYLSKANAPQEYETIEESELRDDDVVVEHIHEDAKTEEKENDKGEKETVEVSPARDMVKINMEYESIEGTIKLYNNQVFIADNIKEVIPEFLMLLKGVIDCPDLPLNVSRSALQNDGFVKKISDYISKKVADKLTGMCKTDRENYEKYWDDISPFIKFGCIKDSKFSERIMDYILYKNLDGKYLTLEDCIKENTSEKTEEEAKEEQEQVTEENKEETAKEAAEEAKKEPEKINIYYVTDEVQQSQYINMFKEQGLDAVILKHNIDSPFISHVEQIKENVRFLRIDADVTDAVKEEDGRDLEEETKELSELFKKALNKDNLTVKVESLKNENVSSMMTISEESRRMQEMMKMYNMYGMDPSMFGGQETLVLNANNKLVQYVLEHKEGENIQMFCEQLYDLALISHRQLTPEEMTKFVARSNEIMLKLAK